MIKTAVILAAGRGTRLRPHTFEIPKGFIQVGPEKLIERSIRILRAHGIEEIIIGCGHLSEQYKTLAQQAGLMTYMNDDYADTGSFHTLFCGQKLIKNDFLLLESDLLYDVEAIRQILETSDKDVILCSGFTQSEDEVFVEISNGQLVNLSKKKDELKSIDAELVGIWKISQSLFLKMILHHGKAEDALTKDYEKAIADLCDQHAVHALVLPELVWCEIDNEEHLERARTKILPKVL